MTMDKPVVEPTMEVLTERLAQLHLELAEVDERRASIKDQLERAKTDRLTAGVEPDPDWVRRAHAADRHFGVRRQRLCVEIGEANRALKRQRATANQNLFYVAVRETVEDATWQLIVARHEALRAEAGA